VSVLLARSLIVLSVLVTMVGCAAKKPPEAPPPAAAEAKKEEPPPPPPPPPKKTAKDVLLAEGASFFLSMDDSPDLKEKVNKGCKKKARKDEKKLEACVTSLREALASEGFKFEKEGEALVFVAFGKNKKGEDVTLHRLAMKVGAAEEGKVTFTPDGKDKGKQAWKKPPAELVIEVADEKLASYDDPKRGKLGYKLK
jgi:hypothetical protein